MPPKPERSKAAIKVEVKEKVRDIRLRQQKWLKERDISIKSDPAKTTDTKVPKLNEKPPSFQHQTSSKHEASAVSAQVNTPKNAGFNSWLSNRKEQAETSTHLETSSHVVDGESSTDYDPSNYYHEDGYEDGDLLTSISLPSSRSGVSSASALSQVTTSNFESVSQRPTNRATPPDRFDSLADEIVNRVRRELKLVMRDEGAGEQTSSLGSAEKPSLKRSGEQASSARSGGKTGSARSGGKTNSVLPRENADSARSKTKTNSIRSGDKASSERPVGKTNSVLPGEQSNSLRSGEQTNSARSNSVRSGEKTNITGMRSVQKAKEDHNVEADTAIDISSHRCPVCQKIMLPPVSRPLLLIPCGHTSCQVCAKQDQCCPLCDHQIQSSTPNIMLQQIITDYHQGALTSNNTSHDQGESHDTPVRSKRRGQSEATGVRQNQLGKTYSQIPAASVQVPKTPRKTAAEYEEDYRSLLLRCDVLQEEESSICDKMATLEREKRSEHQQIDNIGTAQERLGKDIERLQAQIEELDGHKDSYRNKIEELEGQRNKERRRLEMVRTTVTQLKGEINQIKKELGDRY